MTGIVVDSDGQWAEKFCVNVEEYHVELKGIFQSADGAMKFAAEQKKSGEKINFAILDVGLIGIETGDEESSLAVELRKLYPHIFITFITDDMDLVYPALLQKPDCFLLKPMKRDGFISCIKRASLALEMNDKRIKAVTFGKFEIYVDDKRVKFRSVKAKELLALFLDHRGGFVSMEETIDKLWGERDYDSAVKQCYRSTVMQLRRVLRKYGLDGLLESERGYCCFDVGSVDCDYLRLMSGERDAARMFEDEYMSGYEWADETREVIVNVIEGMGLLK